MKILLLPIFFLLSAVPAVFAAVPAYRDGSVPLEERVSDLLGRMTPEEKESLLSGVDSMDLPAVERLGIPKFRMTDGPMGVRLNSGEPGTAFPSGILMAAAFDPDLVRRTASAMAVETLAYGRDMLLGPCVNIARVPQGGRNFESYGEDPWLASRLSAAYVSGLQSGGAAASVKHYALNNQETDRGGVDVRIGERAMHEIYLPAFESAVRAGAWSVMAAYNKVNGRYASENGPLLNGILKERWGFKGFVVSDWGATHGTASAANAGLDVEMPSGRYFGGGKLLKAVSDGAVNGAALDDKVRRVLRAMIGSGAFDRTDADRPPRSAIASSGHRALALEAAGKGMVLLKNEGGLLPLSVSGGTIAVLGPLAAVYSSGAGSSRVTPSAPVSPLEGLRGRAGPGIAIRYSEVVKLPVEMRPADPSWFSPPKGKGGVSDRGLYGEYFGNRELKGRPAAVRLDRSIDFSWGAGRPAEGVGADDFSVRWTGILRVPASGSYHIALRSDDGTRLWIDGAPVID
ncbi:MAG TPA: glycoside hydrolase family 3 N-terminal domain-containing protein, partial [Elusimicrobiales bacterium]|nr:glycoside hydrolase family 3 N-terminal domain-containing protein [Elusimicrobiales bacterium]